VIFQLIDYHKGTIKDS